MQNGKQERVKAGYHHSGGALPFALESGSQSDNLILSFPHVVRFGLIAAYVRTWPVRTYAEKGKVLTYRGVLSAGGMIYSNQRAY